jgi:hypothetical protein
MGRPEMGRRVLTAYKRIIARLGLQQLDVYRVTEGGRLRDVIRVRDPAIGKTAVIKLDTTREALSPREFAERVVEEASRAGIRLSERKVQEVLDQYRE